MGLIVPQSVTIHVTHQNRKHYEALGYSIGDDAIISVCDLPRGTETPVDVSCDFCNITFQIPWKSFLKLRSDEYCCPSCLSTRKKHRDSNGNLVFIEANYRNREWLEREYVDKSREAEDIARECKINLRSLRWWISYHNLCIKNGSVSRALPADEIIAIYTSGEKTTEEIGSQYGVSGNTIADLLRNNGVNIPSRSELMRTYYDKKGGREKFVEYGNRLENRIRTSCRQRGLDDSEFTGFVTSEQHMIRGSSDYEKWRNDVFIRDEYTCAACGKVGGNLNAHHILNFSKYDNLRFDIDNGITLCVKCHNPKYPESFHAIYGEKNNTREQLEEYINNRRVEQPA